MNSVFSNPFRPGAGHMPPYLAGRETELQEFQKIIGQETILQNLVLTGLRGVGKTVLLETFKPPALAEGWFWVGTDFSESSSVSEKTLVTRLLADLAVVTSNFSITLSAKSAGLVKPKQYDKKLDFDFIVNRFDSIPGLLSDKLKGVLEYVWGSLSSYKAKGIVFAYDEAQNLADHPKEKEFPLSLLLDTFQSIQRRGIPFLLVLTGLPTLFPKLVRARTFAERMFHIVMLDKLNKKASKAAIVTPTKDPSCPVHFSRQTIKTVYKITQGYPYFIQYVGREVFDIWVSNVARGEPLARIPVEEILRKLDVDFFAGRWSRATDRQRDILVVIAKLDNSASEFTVQEIVESSNTTKRPFSSSHVNQLLASLCEMALVHKNRWGKYILAVPLLDQFILRQLDKD